MASAVVKYQSGDTGTGTGSGGREGAHIYLIGGLDPSMPHGVSNHVSRYDTATNRWSKPPPMPGIVAPTSPPPVDDYFTRRHHQHQKQQHPKKPTAATYGGLAYAAAAVHSGMILVSGGAVSSMGETHTIRDTVYYYDLSKEVWAKHPAPLCYPRMQHAMVVLNDTVMVFGGLGPDIVSYRDQSGRDRTEYSQVSQTVEIYDSEKRVWKLAGKMKFGHTPVVATAIT